MCNHYIGDDMSDNLTDSNENWFKRHILEALKDLKEGQDGLHTLQQEMHESNITRMENLATTLDDHAKEDASQFYKIRVELQSLTLVRKLVYAALGMVLLAFMSALIAMVISKAPAAERPGITRPTPTK